MELVIDFDQIEDPSKKEWLLSTLKLMHIGFHTIETPQTIDEYNADLEEGYAEIERGEFMTTEELKAKIKKW